MLNTYEIHIEDHGHYKVEASIYKIPNVGEIECEIEIVSVKKFDDSLEKYKKYTPNQEEVQLLEKQIAVFFFNNLH